MSRDNGVPYIFTADELISWAAHENDGLLTDDQLDTCLAQIGRNAEPGFIWDAWDYGLITSAQLARVLGSAWSASEFPDSCMDHQDWAFLFDEAGYTVDGAPADRPTEPIRLYRGSAPERRTDWSWTDNRDVATRYASGEWYSRPVGKVWTVLAPPWALLARNTGRNEDEYVVNTEGLEIEEYTPDA